MSVSRTCGDCLDGVRRRSGGYDKAVRMVWGSCLEGVGRLSGGHGKTV